MDKDMILSQMKFVQTRIQSLEEEVCKTDAEQKGGKKELVDAYNKWVDRLNDLTEKLEALEKPNVELEEFKLEREKFEFEKEKFHYETKANKLELEKFEFEKEKFQQELAIQQRQETDKIVCEGLDFTGKLIVALLSIGGTFALAKLAYANDADLKLCNGRIWGLFKLIAPKI